MIGVIFSLVLYYVSACYGIMGTEVVNKPTEYVLLRWGVMVVCAVQTFSKCVVFLTV